MSLRETRRNAVAAVALTAALASSPLIAVSVLSGAAAAAAAAAASTTTNSLVVTGALKGILKVGATTTCDASVHGAQLSSFTTSLSSTKYKHFSVTASVPKAGTYTKFTFGGSSSFVLQSGGLNAWVATSGTMTIKATSGTVNLTLGAHEGSTSGTLYVKGGWSCKV